MFSWKKLGRIFNPSEITNSSWIQEFSQSPCALPFDEFVRIYFSSRLAPNENGQYVSQTGFIDVDRNDLFNILRISPKPIMELGTLGAFDEFGIYPASIIQVDDEIRVYYAGWTRCEAVPFNAAIGVATSNDGESFERIGLGPVLSYGLDEPFIHGSPRIRKYGDTWVLWYVSGKKWVQTVGRAEPIYKIRMATSSDGICWKKHGRDIMPSLLEENECQACPDVFWKNGKYHMFFSYRYHLDFKSRGRGYQIGYATSEDLFNWTRQDELAGISVSSSGWNGDSVSYPHVFELEGQIYMLYQGNQIGRSGFGLAQLVGELN